jgi:hypothetical protein
VSVDAGECFATGVALGTPTTGDNCAVDTVTNDAPAQFPVGDTIVIWTVTDTSANSGTCAQTVTVIDDEAPSVPTWVTPPTATGTDSMTMEASSSDNCTGVEYEFDCIEDDSFDRTWGGATWAPAGMTCGTTYTFQARARDAAATPNVSGYSTQEDEQTDACVVPGGPALIRVALETPRAAAPASYQVPVTVKFWDPSTTMTEGAFPSGTVLYTFTGNTVYNAGSVMAEFSINSGSFVAGNYAIEIKEDVSLSNLRNSTYVGADSIIYMGELQEGDTSGDGRSWSVDFNNFKAAYPCFASCPLNCEFDGNTTILAGDFNIFKSDYPKFGPHLWTWK